MKILQINAVYGFRSTGLIVRDISAAVEAAGDEAYVAYQEAKEAPEKSYRIGNVIDWKAHAMLSRLFGKQSYFSRGATKRFLKYLDKVKPDIVHLHNLHSNYIHLNLLLEYLARRDIPTVITMHDCWYFTGKCYHYADIGCEKFKSGCGNCPKKKVSPPSLFFDRSKKMYRDRVKYLTAIPRLKIVGCSDWICNEAKKSFLENADIIRIYNGVDTAIFKPRDTASARDKYGIGADDFVIMGMANKWLLPENRELFEKTLAALDENTHLMIVGCKPEELRAISGKHKNLVAIGYVADRVELAELYSLSDAFVNATFADTLPTVNMESICCGTPVITYDSCGSPELVLEGCGTVVARSDYAAVVREIEKFKSEPADTQKCAERGRLEFDKNKNYEKYIELYESF